MAFQIGLGDQGRLRRVCPVCGKYYSVPWWCWGSVVFQEEYELGLDSTGGTPDYGKCRWLIFWGNGRVGIGGVFRDLVILQFRKEVRDDLTVTQNCWHLGKGFWMWLHRAGPHHTLFCLNLILNQSCSGLGICYRRPNAFTISYVSVVIFWIQYWMVY